MSGRDDEDRLSEALAEWLELAEQGGVPDENAFLARYPDLTEQLRKHLANWRRFHPSRSRISLQSLSDTNPDIVLNLSPRMAVPDHDLLEEIGRGGMGIVYRAKHRRL